MQTDLPLFGKLHGVAEQVGQYLSQTQRIADKLRRHLFFDIEDELDFAAARPGAHRPCHFVEHVVDVEKLVPQFNLPGFEVEEIDQVIGDIEQQFVRMTDLLQLLRLDGVQRCLQDLFAALTDLLGRLPDLFADVDHDVFLAFDDVLERFMLFLQFRTHRGQLPPLPQRIPCQCQNEDRQNKQHDGKGPGPRLFRRTLDIDRFDLRFGRHVDRLDLRLGGDVDRFDLDLRRFDGVGGLIAAVGKDVGVRKDALHLFQHGEDGFAVAERFNARDIIFAGTAADHFGIFLRLRLLESGIVLQDQLDLVGVDRRLCLAVAGSDDDIHVRFCREEPEDRQDRQNGGDHSFFLHVPLLEFESTVVFFSGPCTLPDR